MRRTPRRRAGGTSRRLGVLTILFLSVVLGLGASLGARPVWRQIKTWRAGRIVAEGETFLSAGRFESAHDKARAALQLARSYPRALRLAVAASEAAGSPLALHYARALVDAPGATLEDRQDLVRFALRYQQLPLASNHLVTLLAPSNPPPRTLQLAAEFAAQKGDIPAAIRYGRELVRTDGAKATNVLALANSLAATADPNQRDEARQLFWRVATGLREDDRLAALECLASSGIASPEDQRRILEVMGGQRLRTLRENVLLAGALIDTSTGSRSAALNLVASQADSADADGLLRIAYFLRNRREPNLALEVLTKVGVETNAPLFLARISALVEAGHVRSAYDEAMRPPKESWLDPIDLEILRYRLAVRMTNAALTELHSEQLLTVAGKDPGRLRWLVDFAEREHLDDTIQKASRTWSEIPGEAPNALPHLIGALDRQGDTAGVRGVARRIAELDPGRPLNALRIAHLDALLGENLEGALAVAKPYLDDRELAVHASATAALANLRLGQITNAAGCLVLVRFEPGVIPPPSYMAISVAVNRALGRTNVAQRIAQTLPFAALRPEEKELVRPSLLPPTPLPAHGTPSPSAP